MAGKFRKNGDLSMKEWGELSIAGERVDEISSCFERLSRCFSRDYDVRRKLTEEQKERIFDNVCAMLCSGCEQEVHCRKYYAYDNFTAAMELLKEQELASSLEEPGDAPEETLKQGFLERCIHHEDFLYAATEEYAMAKQQLQVQSRMAEIRFIAENQLKEIAAILKEFSEGIRRGKELEDLWSAKLATELRKRHIEMENAVFLKDKGAMMQVFLTVRSKWGSCITVKEAAEAAGRALGKSMRAEGNGAKILTDRFEVIHLSQEAQFQLFTGMARMVKEGSSVSGDTFSIKELPDAKLALMLSDGMGSGIEAQKESCMMVELLEEFLETGFSVHASLQMISTLFLTKVKNPSVVTADIAMINLYNGMAEFYKAGAAPSYLKRNGLITPVFGSAPPAGMFLKQEEEPEIHKLYQGDCIIMMTDGVLEALRAENKDQMMEGYLSMLKVKNPQEMAERILAFAAEHGAHDDMTVLVAAVYESQRKKKRR